MKSFQTALIVMTSVFFGGCIKRHEPVVCTGHTARVSSVAVSPNGQTVVSIAGGELRIWNRNATPVCSSLLAPRPVAGGFHSVRFLRNDSFAITTPEHTIQQVDLKVDQLIFSQLGVGDAFTSAQSRDGHYFATGGDNPTIILYDAKTLDVVSQLDLQPKSGGLTHPVLSRVNDLEFTPDGTCLCAAFLPFGSSVIHEPQGPLVRVWTLPSFSTVYCAWTGGQVFDIDVSPDGRYLAAGGMRTDGTGGIVEIYDLQTRKIRTRFCADPMSVSRLTISHDGKRVYTCGTDGSIRSWTFPTGSLAETFGEHMGPITDLSVSDDGRTLAGAAGNSVIIWELSR